MKLNGLFLICSLFFFGSVSAKAEVLVPVARTTQAVPISTGTHGVTNNLTPVYPNPYPYPYPYYGGYPRYSSFGFGLSIGGFGGGGIGRPLIGGRRCARRCSRPVSRCCARRRCF